jgi:hypothetical protein
LKKIAPATPSAASSRSASSKTMLGDFEDDARRLASELEAHALEVAGGGAHDLVADLRAAGERHLVDLAVPGQRRAGVAKARHDVHHAIGYPDLAQEPPQEESAQRGLLRRLEHHAVAAGQRRPELPRRHQQREVPRDDLAHDAHRLAQRVVEEGRPVRAVDGDGLALDLRGPAGVVAKVIDGERHVGRARHHQRLAVVEALELRELLAVLLDQVRQPPQQLAALARVHSGPRAQVEGAPRSLHGAVDVLGAAPGDVGDGVLPGRVLDSEGLARGGGHEAPSDQQVVLVVQEGLHGGMSLGDRGGGAHGGDLADGEDARPRLCPIPT